MTLRTPSLHALLLCTSLVLPLAGCGPAAEDSDSTGDTRVSALAGGEGGLAIVDPQHPAHPNWVDLGAIPFGDTVRYEVPLANLEAGPQVIQSIQSGCSCTVPSIYYEAPDGTVVRGNLHDRGNVLTVPAGGVAKLLLEVDSTQSPTRNKPKLVVVRIVTDSPTVPFTSLDVRMRIDAPFVAVPAAVDLGRVAINGGGRGSTRILPEGEDQPRITGVLGASEGVIASVAEDIQVGRLGWRLDVELPAPLRPGYRELEVQLSTTVAGEEARPFVVPVRVNAVQDFEVRPSRLLLQPPSPGAADLAEVALVAYMPGLRFHVSEVSLHGERTDDLEITALADRPDITGRSQRWVLRLEAQGDLGPEACSGTVTVVTDSPEIGTLEVPYIRLAPG